MSYTVLARKWRPKRFSELVGQQHAKTTLVNALDQGRLHHAYLFTGTRGVGKTSIARIFAKSLNCESGTSADPCGICSICRAIDAGNYVDLIEIDAASRTRVEDTREILDNVPYAPTQGRYKVYLIDEVHMLSKHSFNALLKTLEEPPSHVKFLLATTDPQKLPITILSRCLQFNLKALSRSEISQQLRFVLEQENIEFEDEAIALLAKAANGSMRDSLSLTDQAVASCQGTLNLSIVQEMLGTLDKQFSRRLLSSVLSGDAQKAFSVIHDIAQYAPDYRLFTDDLLAILHLCAMTQLIDNAATLSGDEAVFVKQLAAQLSPQDIQLLYQIVLNGKRDLLLAPEPMIGFEMLVMRLLAFSPMGPITPLKLSDQTLSFASAETPPNTSNQPSSLSSQQAAQPIQQQNTDAKGVIGNRVNSNAEQQKSVVEASQIETIETTNAELTSNDEGNPLAVNRKVEAPAVEHNLMDGSAGEAGYNNSPLNDSLAGGQTVPYLEATDARNIPEALPPSEPNAENAEDELSADEAVLSAQQNDILAQANVMKAHAEQPPSVASTEPSSEAGLSPIEAILARRNMAATESSTQPNNVKSSSEKPSVKKPELIQSTPKQVGAESELLNSQECEAEAELRSPPSEPERVVAVRNEAASVPSAQQPKSENKPKQDHKAVSKIVDFQERLQERGITPISPIENVDITEKSKGTRSSANIDENGPRYAYLECEYESLDIETTDDSLSDEEKQQVDQLLGARSAADIDQWSGYIRQMQLKGLARQLVLNATLHVDGEQILLQVDKRHQHLDKSAVREYIESELLSMIDNATHVIIEFVDEPGETPMIIQGKLNQKRVESAVALAKNDSNIQQFEARFSGFLDEKSIVPR